MKETKLGSEINAAASAAGRGLVQTALQRHPLVAGALWAFRGVRRLIGAFLGFPEIAPRESGVLPAEAPRVSRRGSGGFPRGSRGVHGGLVRVSRGVGAGVTAIAVASQRKEGEVRHG
jgi:hypothetical protein